MGTRGGAGGCRSPRDGGGGGGGVGGRIRDGKGETRSKAGDARRKMTVTEKTAERVSGRKSATEDLQVRKCSDEAGDKYRVDGTDQE